MRYENRVEIRQRELRTFSMPRTAGMALTQEDRYLHCQIDGFSCRKPTVRASQWASKRQRSAQPDACRGLAQVVRGYLVHAAGACHCAAQSTKASTGMGRAMQ